MLVTHCCKVVHSITHFFVDCSMHSGIITSVNTNNDWNISMKRIISMANPILNCERDDGTCFRSITEAIQCQVGQVWLTRGSANQLGDLVKISSITDNGMKIEKIIGKKIVTLDLDLNGREDEIEHSQNDLISITGIGVYNPEVLSVV